MTSEWRNRWQSQHCVTGVWWRERGWGASYLEAEVSVRGEVVAVPAVQHRLDLLDVHRVLVLPLHLVDVLRHVRHWAQRAHQSRVHAVTLLVVVHDFLQRVSRLITRRRRQKIARRFQFQLRSRFLVDKLIITIIGLFAFKSSQIQPHVSRSTRLINVIEYCRMYYQPYVNYAVTFFTI